MTGGELKSTERADKESLQAGWFDLKSYAHTLELRPGKIIPLVETCYNWLEKKGRIYLPGSVPYDTLLIRLVCLSGEGDDLFVLLSEKLLLPVFAMGREGVPQTESLLFIASILKRDTTCCCEVLGLIAVDHKLDRAGCCLTLVVEMREYIPHNSWYRIKDENIKKQLKLVLTQLIPLQIF